MEKRMTESPEQNNREKKENGASQSFVYRLWKNFTEKGGESRNSEETIQEGGQEPNFVEAVEGAEQQAVLQTTQEDISQPDIHTDIQEQEEEKPQPVPAAVSVSLPQNKMAAVIEIAPPQNGGEDITEEQILDALKAKGVVFGILNDKISAVVQNKEYDTWITVANGVPAIDGVDGIIQDCFDREKQMELNTREDGTVDFKNLNLIENIQEGTVICNIISPKPGSDGTSVLGETVKPRQGREAKIPKGKNTRVSEDGTQLEAACSGRLFFANGMFNVDDVLRIDGNVDNSVGNIDFCGEVIVAGDVYEGFTIKACKDVQIKGTVEGASIFTKGSIILSKGMNGMIKGSLVAEKDVQSKFLENCTVKAGGCVYAESIVNSNISANDKIVVKGKRGVIVGGSCSALNSIEAVAVGASSNVTTILKVGATPETYTLQHKLTRELEHLTQEIEALSKDITYLENFAKNRPLSSERLDTLNQKRKIKTVNLIKSSGIVKQLEKINEQISDVQNCRIACRQIYPPSRIEIGNAITIMKTFRSNVLFYFDQGEIKTGTI